jgi:archaellum component FlaD/FlaE
MKIFNRGNDAKGAAPAGPAAAAAMSAPAAPAPVQAPVPAAPAAPPAPDLTALLDANVKEMSEKIARLTSSLESSQQERGSFEAKIEMMEERMRKLSSLTEMISAQYNPFVGDAPSEREPLPAPEVGLAQTVTLPALPSAAEPSLPEGPMGLSLVLEPPAMEAHPAAAPAFEMEPAPAEAGAPDGVHLWAARPSFESSMLLLGWADMLLKSAGSREAVTTLAHYYHNIGWIGDPARDQLLAYVDGIAAPADEEGRDWRAGTDVHERSLLFVEKLKAAARRTA